MEVWSQVYRAWMRILVTGAGGFVGSYMVPLLFERGHQVIAASHRPLDVSGAESTEVFDLHDRKTVVKIVDTYRPEGVVHLAAQASVRLSWTHPEETFQTNILGSWNLLEALESQPKTRVLLVSSAQVYGSSDVGRALKETDPVDPPSPYAVSKATMELLGLLAHRQFGIPVVVVRPFNHTGPGQIREYAVGSFCAQLVEIANGMKPPKMEVGRLDTKRDFLDVRDVVDAYAGLLELGRPGEIYNVASGVPTRIGDLLDRLIEALGLASDIEIIEESDRRTGDPESLVGDSSKLRSDTGWEPKVAIEQSILDSLAWYRENLPAQAEPGLAEANRVSKGT